MKWKTGCSKTAAGAEPVQQSYQWILRRISSAPVNSAEAVLIVGVSRSLPIFLFVREKRYKKLQRFDAPSILR